VSFPTAKLSVNHSLFTNRTVLPTRNNESPSNAKTLEMKKEFSDLENEIESISVMMRRPKRPASKRGKELEEMKERDRALNQEHTQNRTQEDPVAPLITSRLLSRNRKNDSTNVGKNIFGGPSSSANDIIPQRKRVLLLRNEPNAAKSNEMNFRSNQRGKEQTAFIPAPTSPSSLSPQASTLPPEAHIQFNTPPERRKEKEPMGSRMEVSFPENKGRGSEASSSLPQLSRKKDPETDYAGAVRRREEAKRNINWRREKLVALYRSIW
jgi:hypothetical protein